MSKILKISLLLIMDGKLRCVEIHFYKLVSFIQSLFSVKMVKVMNMMYMESG